jgi:hypothetical protein
MDAFMLGTKLGATQWIYFGITAAIYRHRNRFYDSEDLAVDEKVSKPLHIKDMGRVKAYLVDLGIGLGCWVLFSLVAIAFINFSLIFSLILAALGGIGLGIVLMRRFDHGRIMKEDHA